MVPTVALLGASGNLGNAILGGLAKQQDAGTLNLIVLHRASSDTSRVPPSVQKRVLDSDNASEQDVATALRGVDILISTGKSTPDGGRRFLDNLARLPTGSLKAYVPSWFTTNWTPAEEEDRSIAYRHSKVQMLKYAKSLGLPVTTISCTLFDPYFFMPSDNGIDARGNTLLLYGGAAALASTFSFVRLAYLGDAVGQIVTADYFTGYQHYTVVETEFTGHELVDALKALHGATPTITDFTDADMGKVIAAGNDGVTLGYAWIQHYGAGRWSTTGRFEATGVPRASLADLVQQYAQAPKL